MSNQSFASNVPENTSILQATKYTFIIPDLPFAKYFCQTVNLPGVSTSPVAIPTPFTDLYRHGDTLSYESLGINAIVDEDLYVWEETYKWLVSITKPTKFDEYRNRKATANRIYYDGFLTINTNANNPNLRIKFKDVHPVILGGIQFSTTENAQTIPTADVTFRYDYFEIERL
jgi:hypothetical protein